MYSEDDILEKMIEAGLKASKKVMEIYKKGFNVKLKEDKSPVTEADICSNHIIKETLGVFSDIYWLSEEDKDDKNRLNKDKLFIVDPLDGTADFVNKTDSFSINIAYVVSNRPIIALIMDPCNETYCYTIKDKKCYFVDKDNNKTICHVSNRNKDYIVALSNSHLNQNEIDFVNKNKQKISKVIKMGASTKAIKLARGLSDITIRFTSDTKEWDVCASDLIVKEAGGIFVDANFNDFTYNRENVYNPNGYIMLNSLHTKEDLF